MDNTEDNNVKSVVDFTEIPLSGPIYDGVDAKLTLEVRDFGQADRTLVIRTWIDGNPVTTMVSWSIFTDNLDALRGRLMTEDWDDSLSRLTGGGGTTA